MGLKGLITTITKILQQTRKNTKTFLNLVHCIQPNSLTGKLTNWQRAGVKTLLHCLARNKTESRD